MLEQFLALACLRSVAGCVGLFGLPPAHTITHTLTT